MLATNIGEPGHKSWTASRLTWIFEPHYKLLSTAATRESSIVGTAKRAGIQTNSSYTCLFFFCSKLGSKHYQGPERGISNRILLILCRHGRNKLIQWGPPGIVEWYHKWYCWNLHSLSYGLIFIFFFVFLFETIYVCPRKEYQGIIQIYLLLLFLVLILWNILV